MANKKPLLLSTLHEPGCACPGCSESRRKALKRLTISTAKLPGGGTYTRLAPVKVTE